MSVETALQRIRDVFNDEAKDLSRDDFKELLGELGADIEGHLDALREEDTEQA